MRIRDKKKQTYDRFRFLLEYNIKKAPPIEEQDEFTTDSQEPEGDIFDSLGSVLDGNKNVENQEVDQQQMQEPIENKTDIDVNVNDNQTFEDTASDLLKIHASKIDNLTGYINDSVKILQVLNQKTDEITSNINNINSKYNELTQKVEKLTPPTPLESLNQMIQTTTGAQSIENYWNEYFAKHGRTDLVNGSIYYNDKQYNENEKGMTSGTYRVPDITDSQIKDIIKNS